MHSQTYDGEAELGDEQPVVTCRPVPLSVRIADRAVQVMILATVIAGLLYVAGYPQ